MNRLKRLIGAASLLAASSAGAGLAISDIGSTGASGDQTTAKVFTDQAGQTLSISSSVLASGDVSYSYDVAGRELLGLTDMASCQGLSKGIAKVTSLGPNSYEIMGTVAHGATGLDITLSNGSVAQPQLIGAGSVEYPFFDITVDASPIHFNTTGVAVPAPCGGPQ